MKRRKYSIFTTTDETWWGDCPRWISSMRRNRPDMHEVRGILLTRSPIQCAACAWGHQH